MNGEMTKRRNACATSLPCDLAPQSAGLQASEEGNHLDRLPEPHLVPHDPAHRLLVQLPQPLDTSLLVPVAPATKLKDEVRNNDTKNPNQKWNA